MNSIKGPVIGADVKILRLVNKEGDRDTLDVIIYGNKYFRIGEDFYEAENSILSK